MMLRKVTGRTLVVLVLIFGVVIGIYSTITTFIRKKDKENVSIARELFRQKLGKKIFLENMNPKEITVSQATFDLEYTYNKKLTEYIRKILRRYRSDYSTVVVIENATGRVLSAVGYERKGNSFNNALPFSATHPSASLFKIVTAAELLSNGKITKETILPYKGRGTTLYKYQLKPPRGKWIRRQSFGKAFAYSNNVIFGKTAIEKSSGRKIFDMALKFGFNEDLMEELSVSKSYLKMPYDQYNLAELASGFNKKTMISPLHGAVMAQIVASEGVLRYPRILKSTYNRTEKKNFWAPPLKTKRVLTRSSAKKLAELMEMTVSKGTARGSFRRINRKLRQMIILGGKTGSITGGAPFGKRDWFTGFAMPKNKDYGDGISICVMNINVKKWYVKSSFLAKSIIEYYYKKVSPLTTNVASMKTRQKDEITSQL